MNKSVDVLEALQKRNVNFTFLKKALRFHNLPSARGWVDLLDKYKAHTEVVDQACEPILSSIYADHILAGPCACGIIDLGDFDDKVLDSIFEAFFSIEVSPSDYHSKYPYPLDVPELENVSGSALVEIYMESEARYSHIYTMKKIFRERVEFSAEDFEAVDRDMVESFSKFVGYRESFSQPFDVITFDKGAKKIFVSIDLSRDQTRDSIEGSLSAYHRKLSQLFKDNMGDLNLPAYKNLFPAIDVMYESQHGVVEELYHMTPSGSVKKEVMRDNKDLRTEVFHESGVDALEENQQKIFPYAIKVVWQNHTTFSKPELTIAATLLSASSTPSVNFVKIDGCVDLTVKNMLLSLVS